jgi:hypothetical protein
MFTFNLIQTASGNFGYHILRDGVLSDIQEFTPFAEGLVPMTESEATAFATATCAELNAPIEP